MDVREYLNQSYMLDQQIQCDMDNLKILKELGVDEHYYMRASARSTSG